MEDLQPGSNLSSANTDLVAALGRIEPSLGHMYLGAHSVLGQMENPDRIAMAAHSLRELMDKLPRHIDVPMETERPNLQPVMLNDKVRALHGQWRNWTETRSAAAPGGTSVVAAGLRRAIDKFFAWYESEIPRVDRATKRFLEVLDPSGQQMPAPIEVLAVREWREIRGALVRIAHHGPLEGEQELTRWIDRLDGFLTARLRPRTFDTFSLLDQLIEEGESNADD